MSEMDGVDIIEGGTIIIVTKMGRWECQVDRVMFVGSGWRLTATYAPPGGEA